MHKLSDDYKLQMATLTILYSYRLRDTSIEHELVQALYRELSSTGPNCGVTQLLVAFSKWRVARDRSL